MRTIPHRPYAVKPHLFRATPVAVSLLSISILHLAVCLAVGTSLPMDPFPSSPSNSSLSSSDLDTESTGSFFPDRSTTLGTLMGVSFYNRSTSFRLNQEQRIRPRVTAAVARRWRWRRTGGRRWRFNLCGDRMSGPTSLGEFLQVERSLYGGGVVENEGVRGGSGRLFDNGRVLPPALVAAPPQVGRRRLIVRRLRRLPVLLTGICCGGRKI